MFDRLFRKAPASIPGASPAASQMPVHPLFPSLWQLQKQPELYDQIYSDHLPAYYQIQVDGENLGILNWNILSPHFPNGFLPGEMCEETLAPQVAQNRKARVIKAIIRMVRAQPDIALICLQEAHALDKDLHTLSSKLRFRALRRCHDEREDEDRGAHDEIIILYKDAIFKNPEKLTLAPGNYGIFLKHTVSPHYMTKLTFQNSGSTLNVLNARFMHQDIPDHHAAFINYFFEQLPVTEHAVLIADANCRVPPAMMEDKRRLNNWTTNIVPSGIMTALIKEEVQGADATHLGVWRSRQNFAEAAPAKDSPILQLMEIVLDPATGQIFDLSKIQLPPRENIPFHMLVFKPYLMIGQYALAEQAIKSQAITGFRSWHELNIQYAQIGTFRLAYNLLGEKGILFIAKSGKGANALYKNYEQEQEIVPISKRYIFNTGDSYSFNAQHFVCFQQQFLDPLIAQPISCLSSTAIMSSSIPSAMPSAASASSNPPEPVHAINLRCLVLGENDKDSGDFIQIMQTNGLSYLPLKEQEGVHLRYDNGGAIKFNPNGSVDTRINGGLQADIIILALSENVQTIELLIQSIIRLANQNIPIIVITNQQFHHQRRDGFMSFLAEYQCDFEHLHSWIYDEGNFFNFNLIIQKILKSPQVAPNIESAHLLPPSPAAASHSQRDSQSLPPLAGSLAFGEDHNTVGVCTGNPETCCCPNCD